MVKIEKSFRNGKFQITLFNNRLGSKIFDVVRIKKGFIKKQVNNKRGEQALDCYPNELAQLKILIKLMEEYYLKERSK